MKTIEDQVEKQIKALEVRIEKNLLDTDQKSIASLLSKKNLTEEAIYELNKINIDNSNHKTGDKNKD